MDKISEKIVIQDSGDTLQQVGVDGGLGIHLVQMVRGAGDLCGQPDGGSPLLFQFRLDAPANVYVVDFCHKKSVELIPCLSSGFPRPTNLTSHSTPYRYGIYNSP